MGTAMMVATWIENNKAMLTLAALAVVKVLPPPGTPFTVSSMYKYVYDLLHTYLHVSTPVVAPPTVTSVADPKAQTTEVVK
jgi:hypothetical protein